MTSDANLDRALAARNLRACWDCGRLERLVERTGVAERWEYLAADGVTWVRFWRRNGRVPDAAIPCSGRRES
jgi:hypothetical protein